MTITDQATEELNKIGFRVNIKSKLKQGLCEDCEMKQGVYLENEIARGRLGDLGVGEEETYEEHERIRYLRP